MLLEVLERLLGELLLVLDALLKLDGLLLLVLERLDRLLGELLLVLDALLKLDELLLLRLL